MTAMPVKSPVKNFNLNIDSVYENFCKETESDQVMIYGFGGACGYTKIAEAINGQQANINNKIKKAYDWRVGTNPGDDNIVKTKPTETIEGREIDRINWNSVKLNSGEEGQKNTSRQCKSGITNMVLENCSRKIDKLPIIPVIFSIDAKDNKFPKVNAERLTSRKMKNKMDDNKIFNDYVTYKEMRRAYKLCYDESLNKEIRNMAKKTFKFAKLNNKEAQNGCEYYLEQIPAPWEDKNFEKDKNFESKWEERMKTRAESKSTWKKSWREQINTKYDKLNFKHSMFSVSNEKEFAMEAYQFLSDYIHNGYEKDNELDDFEMPEKNQFINWAKKYISENNKNSEKLEKMISDIAFSQLYELAREMA